MGAWGGIWPFPSLAPKAEVEGLGQIAWLPGGQAFVAGAYAPPNCTGGYPIRLFQLRRPEAAYGVLWLPQFCLTFLAAAVSLWLITRDLMRWFRNPTALL